MSINAKDIGAAVVAVCIGEAAAIGCKSIMDKGNGVYHYYTDTCLVPVPKKHFWNKQQYQEVYCRNGKPVVRKEKKGEK